MSFSFCSFNWINRSGNYVVHATAKFALDGKVSCFFNSGNLPAGVAAVCLEDSISCTLSF